MCAVMYPLDHDEFYFQRPYYETANMTVYIFTNAHKKTVFTTNVLLSNLKNCRDHPKAYLVCIMYILKHFFY